MPQNFNPAEILVVDELLETRDGTGFSSDGHREYTRRFLVVSTNQFYGSSAVCGAPRIPLPFTPYQTPDGKEWDLAALMVKSSAKQIVSDDNYHWMVTCEYSTKMPEGGVPLDTAFGGDAKGSQNNPELEPPEIEWDWEIVQRTPRRDLRRQAFLNSAGQPFKPAPTFETGRAILVMTRNERDFDRAKATSYAFAVNSDTFLGCKPGTVQCIPPRAKQMFRGSIRFWRVTYRLRFGASAPKEASLTNAIVGAIVNPDKVPLSEELESWQPEILDAGLCQLQKFLGIPWQGLAVPIIRHGVPISHEVLLDGKGSVLAPNDDGTFTPVYQKFYVYRERPFAKLLDGGFGKFGGLS